MLIYGKSQKMFHFCPKILFRFRRRAYSAEEGVFDMPRLAASPGIRRHLLKNACPQDAAGAASESFFVPKAFHVENLSYLCIFKLELFY